MGVPTVTPITENRHDGGYIVFEPADGMVTREVGILLTGFGFVQAGTVLGKVAHALTGTAAALGTNVGNGTFGAITVADPAVAGVYTVRMQDPTHYVVEDPAGHEIGHGATAVAFAAGGLSFIWTAGGTAMVAGDSYTITVAAGSGKYVPYDPTGNDGREFACAILFGGRDTTSADKKCVVNTRGPMRVNANELVWGANVTTTLHKTTALAALLVLPGGGIQAT
jgi:hypothetical protein